MMNKKLLTILVAGLLLVSAVACNKNTPPKETGTETGTGTTESNSHPGTDESGNTGTGTTAPTETVFDPTEPAPTFTAASKDIVVITAVATVRSSTVVNDTTGIGWPKEGTVLTVTGESTNWYRIKYNNADAYIAKSVVGDASALEGFTPVENEQIVISTGNEGGAVNVRSYPSTANDKSIRGTLKEGATVTRVAVGEKWSIILYEVVSETETDAQGSAVKVQKKYYISNDCIKSESAESGTAGTESSTDKAD